MNAEVPLQYPGAVLYVDFSDNTPGEVVETPILYNERRDLSLLISQNSGKTLDASARRLVGLFTRAEQALIAARQLVEAVEKLRDAETGRIGLTCRAMLGYGQVSVFEDGRVRGDWMHRLPGLVSSVPEYGIAGLAEFIKQLPPGLSIRPLGNDNALFLIPTVGDRAEDNPQTRHASMLLKAEHAVFNELRLSIGGKLRVVHARECPLLIGRDKSCGIVLAGETASRVHGRFLHDGGKFYYADESRNGSYVLTAAGEELFLQNERVVLVGEGAISPGAPLAQQTAAVVRYTCSSSRLSMAADSGDGDTRPLGGERPRR